VRELAPERRRRLIFRALPALALIAVVSLAAGAFMGSRTPSASERTADDFAQAWQRADLPAMYALLDERSRAAYPLRAFRRAYARTAATATTIRVTAGEPDGVHDGSIAVPVSVQTRVFGRIRGRVLLPVQDERVVWDPSLTFPDLPAGARLSRRSLPPERASLLARDGEVLAEGPAEARTSPLGGLAASVAGVLGPATRPIDRAGLYARGFPRDWPVGHNGLERAFDAALGGVPGGVLLAGNRVVASSDPRQAAPVRTTIDTDVQEAAVVALAGRLGGIAALDTRTGEIRALAGLAFSAPQPPGSTFKIVTTTAALEARAVTPRTEFPVQTAAIVDGVELENANGEFCGGSFRDSFAHSCNSVFAPLGVEIGAERIVNAALRYGWNAPPSVTGEAPSTIPQADEIQSPLEVGSTAIGRCWPRRCGSPRSPRRWRRAASGSTRGSRRGVRP
jgi:penicillin-binding protein A